MQAFTVPHFRAYVSRIQLDTGDFWELEDFQVEIVEPILRGVKETWAVIPEGNAKTTLLAGVALYHCDFTPRPWVPIAASSRDQAEIMARQAYDMIRHSDGFEHRFRIYEGYREIRHRRNGGRGIKVYAADVGTADGAIPTLAICDEGHRYNDLGVYRLWRGKLRKRGGQIAMISTAGEPGTDFEETRDKIRDAAPERTVEGAHVKSVGPGIVMNEWTVQKPADISNMVKVKEANPLSIISVESLTEDFGSPTLDIGDWKRLKCNIPARSVNTAITDGEWEEARLEYEDIPEGEHSEVGVDVAWKHDTFAITPVWMDWVNGYRVAGKASILVPPRDGSTLHPDEVKAAFLDIHARNPIDTAVMDMGRAEDIASWLEDELGVTVIDRPQGNDQAAEDYDEFMKSLRLDKLKHTGHSGLRSHVLNAISRALGMNRRRFDRPSQSRGKRKQEFRVIDALTALAMVNRYMEETLELDEDDDFVKAIRENMEDMRISQA